MSPEVTGAVAALIGAVSTAVLMAAAYYFPRGYHRQDAEPDDEPGEHAG